MPARTTPDAVKGILLLKYDANRNPDLTTFINTASRLVDYVVTQDSLQILVADALTDIESYLAAHFYGHADQFYSESRTLRSQGKYQGTTAMVLSSTQYGQTAMLLDITGTLAYLSSTAEKGGRPFVGGFLATNCPPSTRYPWLGDCP